MSFRATSFAALAALVLLPWIVQAATSNLDLNKVETIFSFGDSISTTGYNIYTQPTVLETNLSTSGGLTWIQYLAQEHTKASKTYFNFASLGATVDNSIVFNNGAQDFVTQVAVFKAFFNSTTPASPWSPATSLFTVWFGSDDLYNVAAAGLDFKSYQSPILTSFDTQIGALYAMGAQNVLFLDIPALYKSPLSNFTHGGSILQDDISYWNHRMQTYAQILADRYPNIQSYFVSSESVFNGILESPSKYDFENNSTACASYTNIVNQPSVDDEANCGAPMSKYFWKDYWRPTWPVHKLLAEDVASTLSKNSTTIGNNTPSVNAGDAAAAAASAGTSTSSTAGANTASMTTTSSLAQASGQGQKLSSSASTSTVAVFELSMLALAVGFVGLL